MTAGRGMTGRTEAGTEEAKAVKKVGIEVGTGAGAVAVAAARRARAEVEVGEQIKIVRKRSG